MEKIKINNQIVLMRKYVKQAKIHVINKLVKQIKFLQNRKGSESQVLKAKRKAERFLEAVALLKKIKPDDVSKLALSKSKDWKQVLAQKNSSLHDRCIAMLANYGAVQKEVETFYNANKELVLKISEYIRQWEEKSTFSKNSPKTNKMSSEKKPSKNIQEGNFKDENLFSGKKNKVKGIVKTNAKSDAEKNSAAFKMSNKDERTNLEAEDSDSDDDDNEEKTSIVQKSNNDKSFIRNIDDTEDLQSDDNSSTKAEELDSCNEESLSDENDEEDKKAINSLKNNNDEEKNSSDEESNVDKISPTSKPDLQIKMANHSKNKLKAITLLNLNELEGLDEIPVSNSIENEESDEKESSEDEANETLPNKTADPFFLGSNSREDSIQNKSTDPFFLSHNKGNSCTKDLDNSSENGDMNISTQDSSKYRTQTVRNSFSRKNDYQFSPKQKFQRTQYNNKNFSKSFKNEDNRERSFKRDKFASKNYHNKFQEKNFNRNRKDFKLNNKPYPPRDTYDRNHFKNNSRGYGKKDDNIPLKNKVPYKKGNTSEPLHPSWEARKKQKELLSTSFQGKRMVFND